MRLILSEVLEKLSHTKNRIEGAELLWKYGDNAEVVWFCYMAFNPDAPKFPFTRVDYKPSKSVVGFNHSFIQHEMKRIMPVLNGVIAGEVSEEKALKRIRLTLETLHHSDAELLHMLIARKVTVKGLTYDVAHRAFPEQVPEKVKKTNPTSSKWFEGMKLSSTTDDGDSTKGND